MEISKAQLIESRMLSQELKAQLAEATERASKLVKENAQLTQRNTELETKDKVRESGCCERCRSQPCDGPGGSPLALAVHGCRWPRRRWFP